jgi:hypothetical protein
MELPDDGTMPNADDLHGRNQRQFRDLFGSRAIMIANIVFPILKSNESKLPS